MEPIERLNAKGDRVQVTPIYNAGDIVRVKAWVEGMSSANRSYPGRLARIEKAVYADHPTYRFADGTFGVYWDMVFVDSRHHLIEYRYDAVELVKRNPYRGLIEWLTI